MCNKCIALQCLATGAHFATGKNKGYETTSACYYADNNTIYVTSQSPNQSFLTIPALPGDRLESAQGLLNNWNPEKQVPQDLKKLVVKSNHVSPETLSIKKVDSATSRVWMAYCFTAGFKPGVDDPEYDTYAKALFEPDPALKIVLNSDIFALGVAAEAGFHGESRLLRYLLIKVLRREMRGPHMNQSGTAEADLDILFKEKLGGKVHMGSNRPACSECAAFMTKIDVDFASKSTSSSASGKEWVHPFYLKNHEDTISPVASAQVAQKTNK